MNTFYSLYMRKLGFQLKSRMPRIFKMTIFGTQFLNPGKTLSPKNGQAQVYDTLHLDNYTHLCIEPQNEMYHKHVHTIKEDTRCKLPCRLNRYKLICKQQMKMTTECVSHAKCNLRYMEKEENNPLVQTHYRCSHKQTFSGKDGLSLYLLS